MFHATLMNITGTKLARLPDGRYVTPSHVTESNLFGMGKSTGEDQVTSIM